MQVSSTQFKKVAFYSSENYEQDNFNWIVPRKSDAIDKKYGELTDSQETYAREIWKAALILARDLPSLTFKELLAKAGKLRMSIADKQGTSHAEKFGALRESMNDKVSTPLQNEYASMLTGGGLDNKSGILSIPQDDAQMDWEYYSEDQGAFCSGFRLGEIDGEKIRLSKYIFIRGEDSSSNVIAHTYPENFEKINNYCQSLLESILRLEENDTQMITSQLGELHWWISQATPYFRGSAACAEIIVAAIKIAKKQQITPWKMGVFADRVALVLPCDEFTALYPSLFD